MIKTSAYYLSYGLVILLLLINSNDVFATWYQGTAQQKVSKLDNIDQIRIATIKKAIANASLQSHSFIKSEDITLDGLLQSSKIILQSKGHIRRLEILDETLSENILTVRVKVDIEPLFGCFNDNYLKPLLIAQFPLLKPSQAAYGGIFDFGRQISKRFEQQLISQAAVSRVQLINKNFLPASPFQTVNLKQSDKIARYLANEYSNQFILFGFIRDISLFEQTKTALLFDDTLLRRNFTLQLYLYDAYKGIMLMQDSYHGEANWQFTNNGTVDTYNSVFWRSDYGRVVLNTISSAIVDITDKLKCQQTLAQVINVNNDNIVINIGSQQGVNINDTFELIKSRTFNQSNGQAISILQTDDTRFFKILHLGEQSTVLASKSLSLMANTQLNDLVKSKTIF